MASTLDDLRTHFPGRLTLTAEDVATVLYGREKLTRGLIEGARAALGKTIIPGLRPVGGRWLVPIRRLAEWLDSLTEPPQSEQQAPRPRRVRKPPPDIAPRRRGRLPDAVRIGRTVDFMTGVLGILDSRRAAERLRTRLAGAPSAKFSRPL